PCGVSRVARRPYPRPGDWPSGEKPPLKTVTADSVQVQSRWPDAASQTVSQPSTFGVESPPPAASRVPSGLMARLWTVPGSPPSVRRSRRGGGTPSPASPGAVRPAFTKTNPAPEAAHVPAGGQDPHAMLTLDPELELCPPRPP